MSKTFRSQESANSRTADALRCVCGQKKLFRKAVGCPACWLKVPSRLRVRIQALSRTEFGSAAHLRAVTAAERCLVDPEVRVCRVCGCTDNDCRHCIAKTGKPCHWVEVDLCSACA